MEISALFSFLKPEINRIMRSFQLIFFNSIALILLNTFYGVSEGNSADLANKMETFFTLFVPSSLRGGGCGCCGAAHTTICTC